MGPVGEVEMRNHDQTVVRLLILRSLNNLQTLKTSSRENGHSLYECLMPEYAYNPVYVLWLHLGSHLGTLQIRACPTQCSSVLAAGKPASVVGMENFSSRKSLHSFIRYKQTDQASRKKTYCFCSKLLGTGYRQVISPLANSTTQSNFICRMKQVVLRSQHPSLFLTQAQLYSGFTD